MCHNMNLLWQVTVHHTWNAALVLVFYLSARPWSVCAASGREQSCPAICSCSNQFSKVVCTRRGLREVPQGIPSNTRYLNLMENDIQLVQADTFRHLYHMEVLQLGRNSIRQIEVGAFNGLTSLNTLELFENRLTVIPSGAFESFSKLRELWLRNNPIESIPSYAFNRVPSLLRLDLGELRRLAYISDGAFAGLVNLKYLNLGMCNLHDMPNLTPLVGLEELEMSSNHFPRIRPGSFLGLTSLRKLWLMNSQIGTIERNAFDDLTDLVELNLAHNNLSSLPHDLFAPLRYLVQLHLHHNPWNCTCDILWLAWWLREYIPNNFTCCGRCHAPAHMRGKYVTEVDPGAFQCSGPVILEPPRNLNTSEGRAAKLRCRTADTASVRWRLPNGTELSHGSAHPRLSVLNNGTLHFLHVLLSDAGGYTCTVANLVGASAASALLRVTMAEINTSNYTYFSTVTVETTPETVRTKVPPFLSTPPTYKPVFVSAPTVLLQSTRSPRPALAAPTPDSGDLIRASLDEVMRTTKIIIGCFVAVTLMAAAMLVIFYKLRKRHQQRSTVAAARTIEIINVEEEMAGGGPGEGGGGGGGGGSVTSVHDHMNYNTYKPAHRAHWTDNSLGNSLHTTIPEPFIIQTHNKDKVQETQI